MLIIHFKWKRRGKTITVVNRWHFVSMLKKKLMIYHVDDHDGDGDDDEEDMTESGAIYPC